MNSGRLNIENVKELYKIVSIWGLAYE
jgi:hypothetical protein